ncbi:hypothetical protein N658DRAFT_494385 [Parathielavia hyrcaniae]|uniref:Uncharacterized protein n=1 Tax=Parathielavia hyrcaniae TaxID=113614 RepID=A0AAN6Q3U0_9PEZI|nr:hypothetical protein N658DRAFT_494385 [Parathielavia hyrcaniae]
MIAVQVQVQLGPSCTIITTVPTVPYLPDPAQPNPQPPARSWDTTAKVDIPNPYPTWTRPDDLAAPRVAPPPETRDQTPDTRHQTPGVQYGLTVIRGELLLLLPHQATQPPDAQAPQPTLHVSPLPTAGGGSGTLLAAGNPGLVPGGERCDRRGHASGGM